MRPNCGRWRYLKPRRINPKQVQIPLGIHKMAPLGWAKNKRATKKKPLAQLAIGIHTYRRDTVKGAPPLISIGASSKASLGWAVVRVAACAVAGAPI